MDPAVSAGPGEPVGARLPPTDQAPPGDAAPSVVVEEIFLEGDGMTMLRHEAGSTQAIDLLASADLPHPVPASPKRP
jgi:hypothetical protein